MGVVGTIVNVHVFNDGTAHAVFGKHTFHHFCEEGVVAGFDVLVERFLHHDFGSSRALSAGIAGVREVFTVSPLLACQTNFVGVDDDDVVATLDVGRVAGFVFAAKNEGNFCTKTTEHLVGSVNNDPIAFNVFGVGGKGLIT